MAKKKVLDNSVYAEQIRNTTWGVDMREPIAKALENQWAIHKQRTVSCELEPMETSYIRVRARIEGSTPPDYSDHIDYQNPANSHCVEAAAYPDNFYTLTFTQDS